MTKIPNYLRQERESRNLALDYALGVSIIGLITIPEFLTVKLLLVTGLILKMSWDIAAKWKFVRGQDILAIAGYLFGLLGAFAMALVAWLTLLTIGLFVPYVSSFKLAGALFTLTWMIGQSINQFYANGGKNLITREEEQ